MASKTQRQLMQTVEKAAGDIYDYSYNRYVIKKEKNAYERRFYVVGKFSRIEFVRMVHTIIRIENNKSKPNEITGLKYFLKEDIVGKTNDFGIMQVTEATAKGYSKGSKWKTDANENGRLGSRILIDKINEAITKDHLKRKTNYNKALLMWFSYKRYNGVLKKTHPNYKNRNVYANNCSILYKHLFGKP